jgi:adenylate kinase family enzyme
MKFGQLVIGPAGSGKSTFCKTMMEHSASIKRKGAPSMHWVNLDPAAEDFEFEPAIGKVMHSKFQI